MPSFCISVNASRTSFHIHRFGSFRSCWCQPEFSRVKLHRRLAHRGVQAVHGLRRCRLQWVDKRHSQGKRGQAGGEEAAVRKASPETWNLRARFFTSQCLDFQKRQQIISSWAHRPTAFQPLLWSHGPLLAWPRTPPAFSVLSLLSGAILV